MMIRNHNFAPLFLLLNQINRKGRDLIEKSWMIKTQFED